MVTSPNEWKILEWDENPPKNKQTKKNWLHTSDSLHIKPWRHYSLGRLKEKRINGPEQTRSGDLNRQQKEMKSDKDGNDDALRHDEVGPLRRVVHYWQQTTHRNSNLRKEIVQLTIKGFDHGTHCFHRQLFLNAIFE